jgi:hypothetical protein
MRIHLNPPTSDQSHLSKNSSGNLLAQKTIAYLTENEYIDKSIQKGFMRKISGCVETHKGTNRDAPKCR